VKRTIDTFKRTGQKIISGIPDASKRSGIEKRIEEVVHQHGEMENKLKKKQQVPFDIPHLFFKIQVSNIAVISFVFSSNY
jgi:predicted nucleotidyltransferase